MSGDRKFRNEKLSEKEIARVGRRGRETKAKDGRSRKIDSNGRSSDGIM